MAMRAIAWLGSVFVRQPNAVCPQRIAQGYHFQNITQTIRSKITISPPISDSDVLRLPQRSQLLPGLTGLCEIRPAQLQRAVISLAGFLCIAVVAQGAGQVQLIDR